MLRHADLCAGIGGFSLGLERSGLSNTVVFYEIDHPCQQILRRHWPSVEIRSDIGGYIKHDADIITCGYPCQPFSVAGKQRAEADERHLWPKVFEAIRIERPRWVIAENVAGHIKLGLDTVISQMESEDYTVWPFVLPATSVGAPHKRERIFLICHAEHIGFTSPEIERSLAQRGNRHPQGEITTGEPERPDSPDPSLADSLGSGLEGYPWHGQDQYEQGWFDTQADGPTGQGSLPSVFCDKWLFEPGVGRMVDGVPDRVERIKALGNSLVPQIVEMIGRAILDYETNIWQQERQNR